MIYASLNAKKGNYEYPAAIATALEFLAKPETKELPVGRYELDGDNIYVLIQDQTTAPVEKKRAESQTILTFSIFLQERKYRDTHLFFRA